MIHVYSQSIKEKRELQRFLTIIIDDRSEVYMTSLLSYVYS